MKNPAQVVLGLINTGALARCKAARAIWKVFQHFLASCAVSGAGAVAAVIFLITASSALADVHYVDMNSTNATPPYTSWTTAATNIQDAVDAAVAGDEIVVTNGTYASGGTNGNGVEVDKPLNVRSVNGPGFTTIAGGGFCAYLTDEASLSGFTLSGGGFGGAAGGTLTNCTLTHNAAADPGGSGDLTGYGGGAAGSALYNCTLSYNRAGYGGGAAYCTLNNCTLINNSAFYRWSYFGEAVGGGAYCCTLNNCTLIGNRAENKCINGQAAPAYGGGAYECILHDCVLTGNSVSGCSDSAGLGGGVGGGASRCTLNNCTLTGNSASGYGGGAYQSSLNNCILDGNTHQGVCEDCASPGSLVGNNCVGDPLFGYGNLRLQSNSPCINAGNNSYATNATDLDGNPRIAGGTVDIGAYEFQSPVSMICYAWLQHFGLAINSSTDTADPDGDAVDNYHEWLAGTDPTNPFSSPAQLTITPSGVPPSAVILTWSTNAVGFILQSTTNLLSPSAWVSNPPVPVVVSGQNTVTNPRTGPQQFYRLKY